MIRNIRMTDANGNTEVTSEVIFCKIWGADLNDAIARFKKVFRTTQIAVIEYR